MKEAIDWTIPFYERQVREFDKFSKSDNERVNMLDQSKEVVVKYRNLREKIVRIGREQLAISQRKKCPREMGHDNGFQELNP